MAGFLEAKPVDKSSVKDGMLCVHCKGLLKDPLQTEDGTRVCRRCTTEIVRMPNETCSECNTTIDLKKCYPDRAAQRDILKIPVFCKYVDLGCEWQGPLKDWELHCAGCVCKGERCPHHGCSKMVAVRHLEGHKLICPFRQDICKYCSSQMPHNTLELHYDDCEEMIVKCNHDGCGQEMKRKNTTEHKLNSCYIEECLTCQQPVYRDTAIELPISTTNIVDHPLTRSNKSSSSDDVNISTPSEISATVHLSDPLTNFRHTQTLAKRHRDIRKEFSHTKSTLEKVSSDILKGSDSIVNLQTRTQELKDCFQQLSGKVDSLESQLQGLQHELLPGNRQQGVDKNLLDRVKELEKLVTERDLVIKKQNQEFVEMKIQVEKLQATCERNSQTIRQIRQRKHDNDPRGIPDRHTAGNHGNASDDATLEPRLLQLERRVEDLSRQSTSTQVHVQELELQLQASLASTHNGAFLWRIPNIARRRRDAIEERITSIYSPPFYTGRNGYKMCIRAYLNGDGQGYNTYLSLFFVIMRGEFDNLLKWPFDHKVSMILVDQNHRKHVVQTFKPTPESSSFQLPRSEMNVASGCPQFAKLSVFDDDNYCKDDTMFIKCIVDTSKIFHP